MKTLKKVLSLVLVVAMIASMLIVGAAAADEKTKYEEAVAVVTGLGIIEGDENGYNFAGNITREQAAKIVTYMLLGKTTAESLKVSAAPFADVAASRWSAPYIAYLKGQGIVSGVSDTEFDPTANVTGIQLAKMMLAAVGYNANGEFEGDVTSAWEINIVTFANDTGLFDGSLTDDPAGPATREEAMLYMFNTLTKIPVVKYNKTFESYYTGTSALNPVEGVVEPTAVETEDGDYTPYYYTLAWQKYELMLLTDDEYVDEFGRPAAVWNADGVDVADTVANAIPDTVLYGSIDHDELYNAIGKVAAEYFNKNENWDTIDVYYNGSKSNPIEKPIKAGYTAHTVAGTGNGAVVEVYVDYEDGHYDVDLVIWYEQIATVTKVAKVSNTITLTGNIVVSGEDFDISGYAKNDVVIYTKGTLDTVSSIRPADEPVVGTYINHTLFTYNIDGVSVNKSAVAKDDTLPELADKGTAYAFYYDSMGNILMAEEYDEAAVTGAYNYVYVKNVGSQLKDDEDLVVKNDSAIILEVVYAAGGKATVNYEIKATAAGVEYIVLNNTKVYIEAGDEDDLNKNGTLKIKDNAGVVPGWYTYTTNEDGEITLKTIGANQYATEVESIAVETGKAYTGTGFAANSKTVLTVVDENGVAVTYNGIANFPEEGELEGDYEIVVTHAKTGTAGDELAKSIIVYAGSDVIASAKDYVYVVMAWSYDDENVLYMAYQNGAVTFVDVKRENIADPSYTNAMLLYGMPEFVMSALFEIKVEEGENVLTYAASAQNGANITDPNTNATIWFETATVDTVDDTYFTTVKVEAPEGIQEVVLGEGQFIGGDGVVYNADYTVDEEKTAIVADNNALYADAGYIMTQEAPSVTYYYDAETVIYDAVNGGFADGISEGDNFIAITDEEAYCEYIWIVG